MSNFTEIIVEDAPLAWLESLGWRVMHGPDIAPETPAADVEGCNGATLAGRLRGAIRDAILSRPLSGPDPGE